MSGREGDDSASCRLTDGSKKKSAKRKPDGREPQRKFQKEYTVGDALQNLLGGATIGLAIICAIYVGITRFGSMSEKQANILFDNFWRWRLQESPEFASFTGCHEYDDRLESYSIHRFEKRKKECERFLNAANHLLSVESLDATVKQNLKLFAAELNTYISGISAKGYLFPVNNLDGVHIELALLVAAMKFETADDYRKLLMRFQKIPTQVEEIIELFREGIKLNMTYHISSVNQVTKQLDDIIKAGNKDSPCLKPLQEMPESIDISERLALKEDIEKSYQMDVLTSFSKLRSFLEKEYFPHLRPKEAISSLPNGAEFYQKCLDFHLEMTMTPQQVHNVGLQEVERISNEIKKVIQKLELSVPLKEFFRKMKAERDFYFKTEEEILDAYRGIVFNTIKPKLPLLFKKIPTSDLVVIPMPSSLSAGPVAYYLVGAPDGSRPGTFYINTKQINESPKYEAMTLSLHEALPGHHLQLSYMLEMPNVPSFRKHVEDRKYYDAPSRFPLHTAFAEGWGLYSEYLGYELDLYDDPYLEYGHLSFEMWRACRLVVDTGIHAFGWSKEKAIDYLVENTGMHKGTIEKEVYRYITWPGQACAYKIGQLKIKESRRKAEAALGSKFDVREFHDVVLQSAGPLDLLQENVNDYIRKASK